jgi:uncharacterized membrane protein YdjX (TVP38/TMEM64 family)
MNTENVGRISISILAIVAFMAYVFAILRLPIPPEMKDVVNTAGGILGGAFVGVVNYWIGSSSGSAAKDKVIANSVQKEPAP